MWAPRGVGEDTPLVWEQELGAMEEPVTGPPWRRGGRKAFVRWCWLEAQQAVGCCPRSSVWLWERWLSSFSLPVSRHSTDVTSVGV